MKVKQIGDLIISQRTYQFGLIDSVNAMLDSEAKVLDVINMRETIIRIVESQKRLRLKLQAIMEDVEQLRIRLMKCQAGYKCKS